MICSKSVSSKALITEKTVQTKVKEVSKDNTNHFLFLVRDKSEELIELLNDPTKLQAEREFAQATRNKMSGGTSGGAYNMSSS
jgi:hypothetical protein